MAKKKMPRTPRKTTTSVTIEQTATRAHKKFMRTSRPLSGKVIGISISRPDDIEQYGYSDWDVNRITVRLSESLLNAGAHLVFGHDWRPDGIMTAICGLAVKSHSVDDSESPPLIQNYLAHPDTTSLPDEQKQDLAQRDLVQIRNILPPTLSGATDSELDRALALSRMRFKMNEAIDARICVGGKRPQPDGKDGPSGFFAGVAEEAYWAAKTGKPLLVADFLGGVTAELIRTLNPKSKKQSNEAEERISFKILKDKEKLYRQASASLKSNELSEFNLPPKDLKKVFNINKLNAATDGLWTQGCEAVDVDSFSAVVRQLKL